MLTSVKKYAELCNCGPANIRTRIKKKIIKLKFKVLPDGDGGLKKYGYIDTKKYPPIRMREKGGGRKAKVIKGKK